MQVNLGKVKGDDGASIYIKYCATATDTGAADSFLPGVHKYIGFLTSTSKTKPTSGYTWAKFVGVDGATGNPGTPGANGQNGVSGVNGINGTNGKNCYVKFSTANSITGAVDNWTQGQNLNWIGFAISSTTTPPTLTADYKWSKFIDDSKLDKTQVLNIVYPIGSIYESTVNTSPSSFIGGTWTAYGAGVVLIGAGTNAGTTYHAGSTGGMREVTLTVPQMPSHKHGFLIYSPSEASGGNSRRLNADIVSPVGVISDYYCDNAGGGSAHENMQPYTVVYRWRRIA